MYFLRVFECTSTIVVKLQKLVHYEIIPSGKTGPVEISVFVLSLLSNLRNNSFLWPSRYLKQKWIDNFTSPGSDGPLPWDICIIHPLFVLTSPILLFVSLIPNYSLLTTCDGGELSPLFVALLELFLCYLFFYLFEN